MGLLDGGLTGAADTLTSELGKPSKDAKEGDSYRRPYNVGSFDEFGHDLTQGKAVEIARNRIPAGLEQRWGYGVAQAQANQGYVWGHFRNSEGESIHGRVVLQWENSTGRESQVVQEFDSRDIDTQDRYNREEQIPLPEAQDKNKASQDEFMTVHFEAETDPSTLTGALEIDPAESEIRIPATEFDIS